MDGTLPAGPVDTDAPAEPLRLVPYGCTVLRLSELPIAKAQEARMTRFRLFPLLTAVLALCVAGPAAAQRAGATHRVRMVGDERGYRFEPARLTVAPGDRVTFVLVSGAPHNVQFDEASVPAAAKARLSANMPDPMAELTGPMLASEGQTYTVSFAGVPAGSYGYVCTPHAAMKMTGTIVVRGASGRGAPGARRSPRGR